MTNRWSVIVALTLLTPSLIALDRAPNPGQIGQWDSVIDWGFVPIHMHVLPNGQVLAWPIDYDVIPPPPGGTPSCPSDPNRSRTWIWTPPSGVPQQVNNNTTNLFCAGHAFLPDGRLLVTGGHNMENAIGLPRTNLFDYRNPTVWVQGPDMNAARWYPTNTVLASGELLTIHGSINHTSNNNIPQVWAPTSGWRTLNGAFLPDEFRSDRVFQEYVWMYQAPNGKVFYAGPGPGSYYLSTQGNGSWEDLTLDLPKTTTAVRFRGSSVMYAAGKILIAGGGTAESVRVTAEVIDLNAGTGWRPVTSMNNPRVSHNLTLLPDGRVLATGGERGGEPGYVLQAEMWDPTSEIWTVLADATHPRKYHSAALLLPDGRVLTGGGGLPPLPAECGGPGPIYENIQIFSPPYLFTSSGTVAPRPTISSVRHSMASSEETASVPYGESFFVETPDASTIGRATWIRLPSVTHSFDQNQRINELTFSTTTGGLVVTAPSDRNLTPPGHYMLFILKAGVPSVAKILRITERASVDYPICSSSPSSDFSDDPAVPGQTGIKAAHINELRGAIRCARQSYSLSQPAWGQALVGDPILAVHITELRTALNEAYQAANLQMPVYVDSTLTAQSPIKAIHINQLRAAVRELPR